MLSCETNRRPTDSAEMSFLTCKIKLMFSAKLAACILYVVTLLAPHCALAEEADLGSNESLLAVWPRYKAKFIDQNGRVIDNANGGISHSEGQGYSMLLAERLDDKDAFARAWTWTRQNLLRYPGRLAAWRWDPASTPHVNDTNNATDADLFMAWALLEAGERWSEPDYTRAGHELTDALAHADVAPSPFGPILKPGTFGFDAKDQRDGPVVNLSYWVFPALRILKEKSDAADWDAIAATGRKLIGDAQFGPRKLPSNWVALGSIAPAPAPAFPRVFGYDAIRIPLYLAWSGTPQDLSLLRMFTRIELSIIDLDTGDVNEPLSDPDYRAISALAQCVLHGPFAAAAFRAYQGDFYYPATLHLLSVIAARDRGCLRP
jgi:endo-1,4-beta-D-glucanase Y